MTFWTPQRVLDLTEHHRNGLSAGESARILGGHCTPSMVSGKRIRLKLRTSADVAAFNRTQGGIKAWDQTKASAVKLPEIAPAPDAAPKGNVLADLCEHECRWPLQSTHQEADAFTRFCAKRTAYTYCAEHEAIAYKPASKIDLEAA